MVSERETLPVNGFRRETLPVNGLRKGDLTSKWFKKEISYQ